MSRDDVCVKSKQQSPINKEFLQKTDRAALCSLKSSACSLVTVLIGLMTAIQVQIILHLHLNKASSSLIFLTQIDEVALALLLWPLFSRKYETYYCRWPKNTIQMRHTIQYNTNMRYILLVAYNTCLSPLTDTTSFISTITYPSKDAKQCCRKTIQNTKKRLPEFSTQFNIIPLNKTKNGLFF